MTPASDQAARTVDNDLVAAYGAKLLAAARDGGPEGLEQVRAELRDVFWAYGLDIEDLTVARTGLAVLLYLIDRAAAAHGGDLGAALTAVATAFAERNPQPTPARHLFRGNIIQLAGEDSWWEVDWRRPGTPDGQVTLRMFEAQPATMGWRVLATSEHMPRPATLSADAMVLRA